MKPCYGGGGGGGERGGGERRERREREGEDGLKTLYTKLLCMHNTRVYTHTSKSAHNQTVHMLNTSTYYACTCAD